MKYVYNDSLDVYVNAYAPHMEQYFLDREWTAKRSFVDLYGSLFPTMGRDYIELYLERLYGNGWENPISEVEYLKRRFREGYFHK